MRKSFGFALALAGLITGFALGTARVMPASQLGRLKDRLTGQAPAQSEFRGAVQLGKADALLKTDAGVVMVGDSITQFGRWNEQFPGIVIANRGIAGDTVAGVAARLAIIRATRAERSFLMVGINDLLEGGEPDRLLPAYEKLVIGLKPGTRLAIQSVLPCSSLRCDRWVLQRIARFNAGLAAIAKRQGVDYLDVAAVLAPQGVLAETLTDDGVHLNALGYQRWQEVLRPHIAP